MTFDKEGYPCSGHDCYDRGNYHMGCGCPYHYGRNNQPQDQQEEK